jgi:hypothetical protein
MFFRLLLFIIKIPLFSAVSSAVIALAATSQTVVFPIDVSQRGAEIINTFNGLARGSGIQVPEVAFQTNLTANPQYTALRYITNGIIPYIQSITQTTHNTLLIVGYLPPQFSSRIQYIVVPVESVIDFLYFPLRSTLPSSSAAFTSTYSTGTLPFFTVDPKQRSADIVSAVVTLFSNPFKNSNTTQVWLQTTLDGPFNQAIINGLIRNVTGISVSNSLIQVTYQPLGQATAYTIILAPEQVQQILYIFNYNTP